MASHSTQRTQPLWPESVCEGVSVKRSHKRAFVSPDPVAIKLPVGEKDAQSIGDVCPEQDSMRSGFMPKLHETHLKVLKNIV